MSNVKIDTIARTIVLFLALANQVLAIAGKEVFPVTEDQVYQGVSLTVTIVTSVWAWWKNNSFTANAIEADKILARLNGGKGVIDHDR
jgi:SPP1 family holin